MQTHVTKLPRLVLFCSAILASAGELSEAAIPGSSAGLGLIQNPSTGVAIRPLPVGSGIIQSSTVQSGQDALNQELLGSMRKAWARLEAIQAMTPAQRAVFAELDRLHERRVDIRLRPGLGTPRYLELPSGNERGKAVVVAPADPVETARRFLQANRELLLLEDPDRELYLASQQTDELGRSHVRFAQSCRGLEVWPADIIVHLSPSGEVDLLTAAYPPTPQGSATAIIEAERALAVARAAIAGGADAETTSPALFYYSSGDGLAQLAWRVELSLAADARWLVVIDAQTGAGLTAFNQVTSGNVTGSGVDLLNTSRALNVWQQGTSHYLVDCSKPMFVTSSTPPGNPQGAIMVVDANHKTLPQSGTMQCSQITSSSATSGWLKDGVSAAFGLSQTYDYYRARHARDAIDGKGGNLVGIVRYGQNYDNAFWNGQAMFFGDAKPYAGALDILAHELTHGVVSYSANLVYQNQSGALNEAFADIFGEMVEGWSRGTNDWQCGVDLGKVSRSMSNPHAIEIGAGYYFPGKMSQFYGPNSPLLGMLENQDNGGVHVNCTIVTHAYYMLSAGLADPLHVTNSARVFYRALTTHLVAQSQFLDCRLACIRSAREIFGENSKEAQRTAEAFDAVEIFDAAAPPPPAPNPTVNNADSVLFVYYDSMYGGWYLARREDAKGDPDYGTSISFFPVRESRPSVTGDGSFGVFVNTINDMCFIPTDASANETSLGYAGQIASVAMAPDGKHYAFVFQDIFGWRENRIRYFDMTGSGSVRTITLAAPSDAGHVNSIYYADTLCFTPDNRFLVYDALNSIQVTGGLTNEVWSIYAYDLQTDRILTMIAPIPGTDVGNPSMGHLGNDLITFEVRDQQTGVAKVIAANLRSGTNHVVGSVNDIMAWPAFNGDDTAIVYSQVDDETSTGASLVRQNLAADHITPTGNATEWVDDGRCGFIYRRGAYTAPAAPKQADLAVGATVTPDTAPLGENMIFTVSVTNIGPDQVGAVTLVNTLPSNTSFVNGQTSQGEGSHDSGKVTCSFGALALGARATATITVKANAAGPARFASSVSGDQEDPNPANNAASVTATLGGGTATAVLTVLASPSQGGTVSGGGTYPVGSQQPISAMANLGWSFSQWQDGSTQNPRTVTVPSGGATYTASFTLTSSSCDSIVVSCPVAPAAGVNGLICNVAPTNSIAYVTNRATLPAWVTRAVLHGGSINVNMGGGAAVTLSSPAAYTLEFDVTANSGPQRSAEVFTLGYAGCLQVVTLTQAGTGPATATLSVQASPAEGGAVTGGGAFTVGSQQQISAAANPGWVFGQWQDGDKQNPRTVTIPAGGRQVHRLLHEPADPVRGSVHQRQHRGD